MNLSILILGGMGPQASLLLHSKILDKAIQQGAERGTDFPTIVHLSLPVEDFISDASRQPVALALIRKHLLLVGKGNFTHIVIACNTAHLLQAEIEDILKRPIVSLIELTRQRVQDVMLAKVGLLASPTTIKTRLFHEALGGSSAVVCLDEKQQQQTEKLIRLAIAGKSAQAYDLLAQQISQFSVPVILGCTELSALNHHTPSQNIIDPLDLVVERIFEDGSAV